MTFILVPSAGEDLQVNAWTWRPTLELLRTTNVINEDDYERMGTQGCGGRVNAELASRIADIVAHKLIGMKPGERLLADLSVSAEHKKLIVFEPNIKVDDIDVVNLYSARYEWLESFAEFCRNSGGFDVM